MEKVKIIGCQHADGNYACGRVEESINDFLTKELPKVSGKLIDIKLSITAENHMFLVTAMIIYKIEDTT